MTTALEAAQRRVMSATAVLASMESATGAETGSTVQRWIHAAERDLDAARKHLADVEAGVA